MSIAGKYNICWMIVALDTPGRYLSTKVLPMVLHVIRTFRGLEEHAPYILSHTLMSQYRGGFYHAQFISQKS